MLYSLGEQAPFRDCCVNENLRRKSHYQADNNAQGKRDTRNSVVQGPVTVGSEAPELS